MKKEESRKKDLRSETVELGGIFRERKHAGLFRRQPADDAFGEFPFVRLDLFGDVREICAPHDTLGCKGGNGLGGLIGVLPWIY